MYYHRHGMTLGRLVLPPAGRSAPAGLPPRRRVAVPRPARVRRPGGAELAASRARRRGPRARRRGRRPGRTAFVVRRTSIERDAVTAAACPVARTDYRTRACPRMARSADPGVATRRSVAMHYGLRRRIALCDATCPVRPRRTVQDARTSYSTAGRAACRV